MFYQRTIKSIVTTVGIGVHTGNRVQLTLRPAPQNTGIVFIRTDIKANPSIAASAENVSNTILATSLRENGVTVSCVEHLMAALWSQGIDNLFIDVSGEEIPIMDGSAAPFIYLIKSAGIEAQRAPKSFIKIKKAIAIETDESKVSLAPYDGFRASYRFVYDHPVFNRYPKHADIDFGETSFVKNVSRARSFGLIKDLDQAQTMNKCLGSSLESAVGIDDYNILNQEGLRYTDEFVKHKLLDAIGDLYLLGHAILGKFSGYKSGHSINNQIARALLADTKTWELVSFASPKNLPAAGSFLQPIARAVNRATG